MDDIGPRFVLLSSPSLPLPFSPFLLLLPSAFSSRLNPEAVMHSTNPLPRRVGLRPRGPRRVARVWCPESLGAPKGSLVPKWLSHPHRYNRRRHKGPCLHKGRTWPHSLYSNHNHATITPVPLGSLEVVSQSRQQSRPQSRSGRRGGGAVIVPSNVLGRILFRSSFKSWFEQSRTRLPDGLSVIVGVIVGVIVPAPRDSPTV